MRLDQGFLATKTFQFSMQPATLNMPPEPCETLCIVGAGLMGAQIGLQSAAHGHTVWLVDNLAAQLQRAKDSHTQELTERFNNQQITAEHRQTIPERIHFTTNLNSATSLATFVIEAVPERLDIKQAVFEQLDSLCSSQTILATNSSSFRISEIEAVTQRPERVLNMHFFAPVWQKPLVELMGGTTTSDQTIERARQLVRAIGLTPLLVRKQSTGFIFNRVWRAIKKECLHLVDEGVASPEDVDRAWMVLTGGSPGPFGLMDLVGLDVVRDIEMNYWRQSGDPSDAPPRLLLDKLERGELGRKSGQGFYSYPNPAFESPGWLHLEEEG